MVVVVACAVEVETVAAVVDVVGAMVVVVACAVEVETVAAVVDVVGASVDDVGAGAAVVVVTLTRRAVDASASWVPANTVRARPIPNAFETRGTRGVMPRSIGRQRHRL